MVEQRGNLAELLPGNEQKLCICLASTLASAPEKRKGWYILSMDFMCPSGSFLFVCFVLILFVVLINFLNGPVLMASSGPLWDSHHPGISHQWTSTGSGSQN